MSDEQKTESESIQLGLVLRAGTVTMRGVKLLEEVEKRSAGEVRLA